MLSQYGALKVNDKNLKRKDILSAVPSFGVRCTFRVGKFFPLFLLPLFAGCQSGLYENTISLNNNHEISHIESLTAKKPSTELSGNNKINSNESIVLNGNINKEAQLNNEKEKLILEKKSPEKSKKIANVPTLKSRSSEGNLLIESEENSSSPNSEDLDDQENLILNSTDEALSAEDPLNNVSSEDMNAASTNEDSALLCQDSVYYNSWQEQFDKTWIEENGKNYKTNVSRNRALSQARTNRFIQIAYPTIDRLEFDFPIVINSQVLQWINYFRGSGRKSFVVWLKRSRAVIPEMEKTLEIHGLPKDLVYLSMIESGYSPKALSSAGAVGLWQFMPATGREYGLKINDYVDERRNLKKSTKAAARYLTNLYGMFESWHLAAASYNGGPGRVQRTLRNYGEDSTFFDLTSMGVVNRETADYVPKLIAAMIISKNPDKFGFDITAAPLSSPTKTIQLSRSISLSDLARSINVDKNTLESLNPELRLGITPPPHATSAGNFELEVPASKFDMALASIDMLPNAPTQYMLAARIKRRETVTSFAARYRIKTASVLKANAHLKANSNLQKGQVVYIPVSLGTGQYARLASSKYANAKYSKIGKHKKHLVVKNKIHNKLTVKSSIKKNKSTINAKKVTRSVTLKKKINSGKKVATANQKKKQHNNVR
ncbi:lytic transglycosylase domain-containing protein [Fluviispira multicolorata]|uniref:Transglycosylase SLT domain-containing protein n=1 Tax=Fluviispira multicolorata TaxID=2654512 RepID=A0A833JGE3_9BACT|nr:lytic transglycosylase domain-containing protein [Fluviispira multicolorata]KAB8032096.1 transglycosylase SLT domain-containing protein [Fluviispira multicolorata]